jgi:CBS domain-containing protein
VLDPAGAIVGVVSASAVRFVAAESDLHTLTVAADLMQPVVAVSPSDDLRKVAEVLIGTDQRELVVLASDGRIAGFIHESTVTRAHLSALARTPPRSSGGGD